jgi:hypothetical protein
MAVSEMFPSQKIAPFIVITGKRGDALSSRFKSGLEQQGDCSPKALDGQEWLLREHELTDSC